MKPSSISSPLVFLRAQLPHSPVDETLVELENWWRQEAEQISITIDRTGTPRLNMFNAEGGRIDEIEYSCCRQALVQRGYDDGIIWRVFQQNDMMPFFERAYLHAYFDPGLVANYANTLQTALAIQKYGTQDLHFRYLSKLLKHDEDHWQGAFWITEIGSGSNPGNSVQTSARLENGKWVLNGSKFYASTPDADVAIVAAKHISTPDHHANLTLFAVPRKRENGDLNFHIRRLKEAMGGRTLVTAEIEFTDAEAWLLGDPEHGNAMLEERNTLNRMTTALISMSVAQRAISDAADFASTRQSFGRPLWDQPLMRQQFRHRMSVMHAGFKLAWEPVNLLNTLWKLKPPYSDRYQLYRLISCLAKYWTAEFAAQSCKWNMEVQAGSGLMDNSSAERRLRDAMTQLTIADSSHRQMLEAIKLLQKSAVYESFFNYLEPLAQADIAQEIHRKTNRFLDQPIPQQEESAEPFIKSLSWSLARSLIRKPV